MTKKNYDELAAWAENDMTLPARSTTAVRGNDAAKAGGELLQRSAGRPSLGGSPGASPKRQVRLSEEISEGLDALAARDGVKAGVLMRDAITAYVQERLPARP